MRRFAAIGWLMSATAVGAQAPQLEIVSFQPASGSLAVGAVARSVLRVLNHAGVAQIVWFGYSVRDSGGAWFDVPSVAVSIRERSEAIGQLEWRVPAIAKNGPYLVAMAVWTAPPGSTGARRMLAVEQADAFRVRANPELLMEQPGIPWRVASHPLGRGIMQPMRVFSDGRSFRLTLAAGRCDGAEMRTTDNVGFGVYEARMKAPNAPGSLSALFLYKVGSGDNDEIDIEIFNDATRRALLTAWIGGKKSREAEIRLPFDPRAGFHDYTIDWSARALIFRIDGKQVARWTRDYPTQPMRVVSNVWWPTWLECAPLAADRSLEIQSIRLTPAR